MSWKLDNFWACAFLGRETVAARPIPVRSIALTAKATSAATLWEPLAPECTNFARS